MISTQAVQVSDEPLSVVVARNIRAEAARRGYTQAQLADALGIARVGVTNRHGFHTKWTIDEIERAAALFDMPLMALLMRPELLHRRPSQLGADPAPAPAGRDAEVFTFRGGFGGQIGRGPQ